MQDLEPLYIVAGLPRSGTSMMMRCLVNAGLPGMYYDDLKTDANPNGFYEGFSRYAEEPLFYLDYKGKVLKIVTRYNHSLLLKLPVGRYKIIYMKRNPLEIEVSMANEIALNKTGICDLYEQFTTSLLNALRQRDDIEIAICDYNGMIQKPIDTFTKLVNELNLPIDVDKAASLVDSNLYRVKA